MLESDHFDQLKSQLSVGAQELLENEVSLIDVTPKQRRYKEEIMSFAVTLHYYSPRAYEYVKRFITLPAVSTIRRKTSAINLANKLSGSHIHYADNKMKVKYAVKIINLI